MERAGCPPDVVSHSTLVGCHARAGDVQAAAEAVAAMFAAGVAPNEVTWRDMLRACANAEDKMWASVSFRRMIEVGTAPTDQILRLLLTCLGKQAALELCHELGVSLTGASRKFQGPG